VRKAAVLASRGLAQNYFLFTNARVTGQAEADLRAAFENAGVKCFAAYGADRISQFIRESSRLRMLVPRVYGLGDLSQILDDRAYTQAREILSALGDDLAKFVITDAFRQSAKALVEHGFVLLLGEPACGKSTIAAALSLGAVDEWGCSILKIRDAEDFVRHWNPNEPSQFFWLDDAFGATQLDLPATLEWNRALSHVGAACRRGAKVIFTSRDYVYRAARNFLKQSAFPLMKEAQVVVRVEQLTKDEKEQILYNHIRLGAQPREFKSEAKLLLPVVSAHERFTPEIARRLGDPMFTRRLTLSPTGLTDFVGRPMALLQEVIQTLDADSRSAIALIFMRGGSVSSPVSLSDGEKDAVLLLGGSLSKIRDALMALEGSLLIQVAEGGDVFWRFKHPTIRDAFAELLVENRELMDIYLVGTPLPQLFREISCGHVELEGVKVVVPSSRYEALLMRMGSLVESGGRERDVLNRFLAQRVDREFLESFVKRYNDYVDNLSVWSYLSAVSDVDVIVRLVEFGLLSSAARGEYVRQIRELAVETPDSDFLRENIQPLFAPGERDEIVNHVRTELLPKLSSHVDAWRDNHDREEDPDSYFSPLVSALRDYRAVFSDLDHEVQHIDAALAEIEETLEQLRSDMPREPDLEDIYGDRMTGTSSDDSRSIFDDVDS
jgi:energy-coupling factor transporter ATP-binding protein EcfA2